MIPPAINVRKIARTGVKKNIAFEGESFLRTVIWEFPSYEKAIECHNSSEYKSGWDLAKKTTTRHMQVIEGFSIE